MTYIIHGATGAQGAPVVASLLARGLSPTAAVRNPYTYQGPAATIAVDLSSIESLTQAYLGVDAVFVHLPVGPAEEQQRHAEVIVEAVRRAQPRRIVVSTSGYPFGESGVGGTPMDTLVVGLRSTGVSLAVVAPKLFLENLLLPPVMAGVEVQGVLRYPVRDDYAISWSSHLDVADVVVRLMQDSSVTGVVEVGALPGLVGEDLARGFAAHGARPVAFEAQSPDEFAAAITPLFGVAGATPVVDSYRWRATQPDEVIEQASSAQTQLGLIPRSVAAWLAVVSA